MSFLPGQPVFTPRGTTNTNVTATGWIFLPSANTAGCNVACVSTGGSGLHEIRAGSDVATPANNDVVLVSDSNGATAGSANARQNLFVPAGDGLHATLSGTSQANADYDLL